MHKRTKHECIASVSQCIAREGNKNKNTKHKADIDQKKISYDSALSLYFTQTRVERYSELPTVIAIITRPAVITVITIPTCFRVVGANVTVITTITSSHCNYDTYETPDRDANTSTYSV